MTAPVLFRVAQRQGAKLTFPICLLFLLPGANQTS